MGSGAALGASVAAMSYSLFVSDAPFLVALTYHRAPTTLYSSTYAVPRSTACLGWHESSIIKLARCSESGSVIRIARRCSGASACFPDGCECSPVVASSKELHASSGYVLQQLAVCGVAGASQRQAKASGRYRGRAYTHASASITPDSRLYHYAYVATCCTMLHVAVQPMRGWLGRTTCR